jgi:Uma2 family endonuclease
MALVAEHALLTVDDIDAMPEDGIVRELVHGELREWMSPGPLHGSIEGDLHAELHQFVKRRKLGFLMVGEARFLIKGDPHHARMADVAFVAGHKYPSGRPPEKADATEPDFVAEIVTPDDTAEMVQEKIHDWLSSGARLIWYVYPNTREVVVYRPGKPSIVVPHSGILHGYDVFSGLRLRVATFLP